MPRNIEIKATLKIALSEFHKVARNLSDIEPMVLKQEDVFFCVPNGRLKMRKQEGHESCLVFYDRADCEGPKLSNYEICSVNGDSNLESVLTQALGKVGVVRKTRTLYMVGQTRLHVDEVEGLGNFVELEVVLQKDQTAEEGQLIADSIMNSLGISINDLLKGAYMDYILNKSLLEN